MKPFLGLLLLGLIAVVSARPPRAPKPRAAAHGATPLVSNGTAEWDLGIEYNRYLQEVVQVLESDKDFRKKLEEADVEKIRDGSIAEELDFINHGVRSKLDDLKRQELERLRHLAVRQFEQSEGIDRDNIKIPGHVEFQSHTFEKEDLRKLIMATTKDLEEADRARRGDFKKYEMEKKFEQHERLNHIEDEEKRKEEEKRLKELEEKHKKHEKPRHPMTKDQLEEVWEDQDHMRAEDWDPKTFFAMHDLNGDNHWDEDEVRMLFKKELDKVYDPNAPEDDMRERSEEMERMREHVFKESDLNKDKLVSYEEFLAETQREEFNGNDPGWDTLDEEENEGGFTDEEFKAYEMQRQREIQDMLNRGIVPPGYPYYGEQPQGAHPFQVPQPHMQAPPQHPGAQQAMGIPGQPAFKPEDHQQQFGGQQQQQQFGGQQQQFGGQQQMGQGQAQGQAQVGQGQQQQYGQGQQQQFGQGQQQQQFGGQQAQQDQPPMGHPQMGQQHPGQPPVGQPPMGQQQQPGVPQLRQPQGQAQMGQQQPGQPPMGQPQMGQPQAGQQQMGQPPMGQQQPPMGQQQPPMGQPQGGQQQPPMGQPQGGQPPPPMGGPTGQQRQGVQGQPIRRQQPPMDNSIPASGQPQAGQGIPQQPNVNVQANP